MTLRVIVALFALWLTGCGTVNTVLRGSAKVESIDMSVDPPAQISVFLTAETGGEPLDRLLSTSFQVYEDGQLVDAAASQQTLLDPARVTSFHTLLLLDLTADAAIPQNRTALARAAGSFVDLVRRTQSVSVYAFDGAPDPVFLAEYPQAQNAPPVGAVAQIESFTPRDASRDLRSNVEAALKELNARLMGDAKPLHVGTLVVFTQGPDLAGRVDEDQFYATVGATKRDIVVIDVEEKPAHEVEHLGNRGLESLDQLANAGPVFERAAIRVGALKDEHYLLSYCSPSRAGKRLLRIDVTGFDEKGDEKRGSLSLDFDSTGFGPGCDANATPRFGAPPANSPAPAPAAAPASAPAGSSAAPAANPENPEPAPPTSDDSVVPPPSRPEYGE